MNLIKLLFEFIFKLLAHIYIFLSELIISILIFTREGKHNFKNVKIFKVGNIDFEKKTVTLDGYDHQYIVCGNPAAKESETLIMMGGIPTDSSESMIWMAEELSLSLIHI